MINSRLTRASKTNWLTIRSKRVLGDMPKSVVNLNTVGAHFPESFWPSRYSSAAILVSAYKDCGHNG